VTGPESNRSRFAAGDALATAGRRAGALVRAIPLALAIVVAAGVALRACMWLAYDPVMLNIADTAPYVSMADNTLFADSVRTAGYSMFLRVGHAFSTDLDVTLAIQHLLGIVTGLLAYATVRRAGAPVWAGVIAAAAVLLSLDQVLVEHTLISEVVFSLLLVAGLYSGVRALDEPSTIVGRVTSRHLWLVAAGALLAFSVWARAVSAPLIPLLGIFFVFALPGTAWVRLGRGALAAGAGAAVLLGYFALNSDTTGTFGLARATGWTLYSRAAPFADCSQFTPPQGTRPLCEVTPIDERSGPDFYTWNEDSPARMEFGYPPANNEALGQFGRRAILASPRAYVSAVGRDTLRYFFPDINDEQYLGGTPYEYLDIHRRDRDLERDIQARLAVYYEPESLDVNESLLDTLTDFQQALRVHPILMLQALILGALGIWLGSGRVRAALVLLLGTSLILLVFPAAIGTYNVRYTIPIGGPLIGAGVIGLWVCIERLRGRQADAGAVEPHPAESI